MVFHWSLSDSKSRQVSWTLLSILSDLKKFNCGNALDSSNPVYATYILSLWGPIQVHQLPLVSQIFKLQILIYLFAFILLSGPLGRQNPLVDKFLFFFLLINIGSGWNLVIRLYLKIQDNFCVSFSHTDSSLCCDHGQILISCTIPS